jgi:tetratricopeptide (TPR) repeat protein
MSDIALYFGWYDQSVSGPFANGMASFRPGAIAYHLHSFSARTLRVNDVWWAGPLLARGATATLGCTEEPYLEMTPQVHILTHRLLLGKFTFGEAAYASQRFLSWQTTVVGDPLYAPFALGQRERYEALEARNDPNIEWSMLMWINVRLAQGAPLSEILQFYASNPTSNSAVLQEKLGDIYKSRGKMIDAMEPYLNALKLNMHPLQRLRVSLSAASLLSSFGKPAQAMELYLGLLRDFPDYPGQKDIYERLAKVAARLGKAEDAARYGRLARGEAASSPAN